HLDDAHLDRQPAIRQLCAARWRVLEEGGPGRPVRRTAGVQPEADLERADQRGKVVVKFSRHRQRRVQPGRRAIAEQSKQPPEQLHTPLYISQLQPWRRIQLPQARPRIKYHLVSQQAVSSSTYQGGYTIAGGRCQLIQKCGMRRSSMEQ